VSLPGKTVIGVAGLVTNTFGNSSSYSVVVNLALANTALLGGAGSDGNAAVFDATGKIADAGAPPVLFRSVGFAIGWNGGAALGEDLAGHRPTVANSTPVALHVRCVEPPSGAAQTIDVRRWRNGVGVSILNAPISVAAGSRTASTASFAAGVPLESGDYLTINSAQASGTPGANVFVELILR
jgi:hypothetical protein